MDKGFINLANDYISAAHNYVCAAEALAKTKPRFLKKKRCNFLDIVTQTLGQSAEVILKAALASKGHPEFSSTTQRGNIFTSHNLKELIEECEKNNVQIDPDFKFQTESISDNYKNHDFRYPRSFYGFTENESAYLDYLRTGSYGAQLAEEALKEKLNKKGMTEQQLDVEVKKALSTNMQAYGLDDYKLDDAVKKILDKNMKKQGLVAKSRMYLEKYIVGIKKQIEIVSKILKEVENATN